MLKIMLNVNSFNTIKKCLLRVCALSSIAIFTTWNHIINSVANCVYDSVESIVNKGFTCFSDATNIVWKCVTVKTAFLTKFVERLFSNLPLISSLLTSIFDVVISDHKVSSVPSFFKSITYKSFASTTTRFCGAPNKHTLLDISYVSTNTKTFPISSSSAVFSGNRVAPNSLEKIKLFTGKVYLFHTLLQLGKLYHKNEVKWYA